MQGNIVISPQERLPGQLILSKDERDFGSENGQVSVSLSSDLPGQRRGIFAMQQLLWQGRVCADGLSSPSAASGLALVWRLCHWIALPNTCLKMPCSEVMWA